MALTNLIPTSGRNVLGRRSSDWGSVSSLQNEMNRVFDDFFGRMGIAPFRETPEIQMVAFCPNIDITESQKEITVAAELAGMDEKDITVNLEDDCLSISGERKVEELKEYEESCCREMTYGSFQRTIPLNARIDADKVQAKFKNGVLRITLPKVPEPERKKGRKIEIRSK